MRIHLLLTIILVVLAGNAQAAEPEAPREQYLCVTELATGFIYDNNTKQWKSTKFSDKPTYVISKAKGSDVAFWITEVGEKSPDGWCNEGFNNRGYLFCDSFFGKFRFNRTNSRFIQFNWLGYIEVGQDGFDKSKEKITDDNTDTPMMKIGKCSPF